MASGMRSRRGSRLKPWTSRQPISGFVRATILFASVSALFTCEVLGQDTPRSSEQKDSSENPDSGAVSKSPARTKAAELGATQKNDLGLQTIKNILRDQRDIWTSPPHFRLGNADWLVPFAGFTAGS